MASFDVIFIGGGPAGYVGAIRAAQLGLNTAVVEREGLGGTCVIWGCIPAKALLEASYIAEKMKKAPEFGVTPGDVKLDFGVAMKRSRAVSTQNSKGVEFADVFSAFGSQVTLVEVMPNILPVEDADCSKEVERAFKKRKIDVLTGAKISNVKVGKDTVSMTIEAGGEKKEVKADVVLVAAGRAPNIEEIGLKELGVQLTDRGFIKINELMETSVKGLYAIGDVAGPPMLAHKGEREGVIVAEVIAGKHPHLFDYTNVPGATYCHPEVASVGLTEQQCKDKKLDYKVGKFPFSANGRARTSGETEGFVKIIRGGKYGEI